MSTPAIYHCVVSNKPNHPILKQIRHDADVNKWDLTVLGSSLLADGTPLPIGPFDGFGFKILLAREFLNTLQDDDIMLFTDGHDVRILATPEEVIHRFLSFNTRIVFSAERNCWPYEESAKYYKTTNNPFVVYKYLNSGGYIGYVSALKQLIDEEFKTVTQKTDDQGFFTQLYLKHQNKPELIRLDTMCTLFQSLHLAENDIDISSLRNTLTKRTPLIWHGNGGGAERNAFFRNIICEHVL
jgi:procollagen-lysine,2-oxoglutarate 5-dioxygenase, invertebrate